MDILFFRAIKESWIKKYGCERTPLEADVAAAVSASIDEVFDCLDKAVYSLRKQIQQVEEARKLEFSEEESKRIDLMTAISDDETFTRGAEG